MAMTKSSMADFIETEMSSISTTPIVGGGGTGSAETRAREFLEALCQGIIDEIVANATIVTTSGAPDNEHTGNVNS
jgi:hypothetical protein